jgi:tape measure domain-containing protein
MAGLHFDITGDNSNFIRKLHECENGVRNTSKQIEQSGLSIEDLFNRMTKAAAAFGAGFTAKELISNIAQVRGEFQQLEVAFKTMLGSEDKANALMQQLVKTAATTPFDLQGVANGAKQLLAYGENAENVNDDLIRLGNIAAGLSQPLGDIVYLYGTTMTQGRLYTQDLNQFTGRGIPMIRELAKVFGVAEGKVKSLVEVGKVGFPEVQKVIQNLTNEGGMFYNLMQEQSKTITGQISNIEDAISTMFNEIGKANEGIINDALSGVSYLIENYEKVGVVIASIAASYGTYKAALVAVNIAERVNIMLLRQAVVEKRLAAAANITLSNSMAVAAARGKMFALIQKNIISSLKGVGKTLTNPYVLLAAAVGAATYGLYKFYTRETEVERMQRQYNDSKEAAAKREEEHKAKVDELINSIENETTAQMDRVGAIETLKQIYPGIIEKYIDEEGHLKNLIALKKELAEFDANKKANQNQVDLQSYDERIKSQEEYIDRMRTNDQSAFDDEIAKLEELRRQREITRQKVVSDYINNSISGAKSMSDDELKNSIKAYKDALSQNMGKEWFDSNQEFKTNEIKQYVSALEDLQKARLNAVKNKKYWEEKKKEAEDARNALDVSKKNSEEWNKYTKQIQEAQKQIDKYSDSKTINNYNSIIDQQKKISELLDKQTTERKRKEQYLENQLTQSRIDAMAEGEAKIRAQRELDNKKEIQDLERQREDYIRTEIELQRKAFDEQENLRAKQTKDYKKRTFDPSTVKVDTAAFDKILNNTILRQDIYPYQEEMKYWNEYLKEYGTFQQKKAAINEEYNLKISEATTKGAKKSLEKEKENKLKEVSFEELKSSINFANIFGNLDAQSTEALVKMRDNLKDVINKAAKDIKPTDLKALQDAFKEIDLKITVRNPLGELKNSADNYRNATSAVIKAQEDLNTVIQGGEVITKVYTDENGKLTTRLLTLTQAENNLAAAQSNRQQALSKLTQAANSIGQKGMEVVNAGNDVVGMLENFGVKVPETISKTLDGIGQVMSGLERIDLTKPFSAITGAVSVLAGVGNTIAGLFGFGGADYSRYNEMVDEYNKLNEIWDELIDKKKEYIDMSYGPEAAKAGDEAIEIANKSIESYKILGRERLQSGASAGSHSIGVRIRNSMSQELWDQWDEFAKSIGKDPDFIGGRLSGLFDLTAEQLEKLKEEAPGFWSKLDGDVQNYLNKIIEGGERIEDIQKAVQEQLTQTSFDSLFDSFIDTLMDMDASSKDFADNFGEYMRKAVFTQMFAKGYEDELRKWYESFSAAMGKEGGITSSDIKDLREGWDTIVNGALEDRKAWEQIVGGGTSTSQESSKKGFGTEMTHEDVGELSGRFTALQIAGEEIKNQMIAVVMGINSLTSISSVGNEVLNNILTQHVITNSYLDDIAKYTKLLNDIKTDISEVRINTKGLSTR